ncbi:carbohydrate ABC transporter permease [Pseudonocardia hispaniensis]|uniref:Carbohydrate ABC transporter permease n=1 Tax=Pseudonocardia hispaniensis TaxID=904933 RepID=A0ABW1J792_9PSEU
MVGQLGSRSGRARRQARAGWLLSSPAILAGLVVSIYPLVYLLAASVSKSTLGRPFQEWVGAENFSRAIQDGIFTGSLVRSTLVAIASALVQVALGLGVAVLLRDLTRGVAVVRTLILLPLLTPPVMAAVMWKLLLDPNGGVFNAVLRGVGLIDQPLSLLGSPTWAIVTISFAETWQWTPFVALLVYAGLLTLPKDVYEAAQLDGLNAWQTFRFITLPMITPTLASVFLIKLILSFKLFDPVYILTAGGPGDSTMLSSFLIFRTALREFDVSYAAAMTLLLVVLITIVTIPVMLLNKRAKW